MRTFPNTVVLSLLLLGGCRQGLAQVEGTPFENPKGFAVIELFTSEGCNSCPPADSNLARAVAWAEENELPLYCLSFHVDYWDYLGWDAPFGSADYSKRQRAYAQALGEKGVYTPQMIVNGREGFVGSRGNEIDAAVARAFAVPPGTTVEVRSVESSNHKSVKFQIQFGDVPEPCVLTVALVQKRGEQRVTAGENRGRQLQHVHIVRGLKSQKIAPKTPASAEFEFVPPADLSPQDFFAIAFVQLEKSRQIIAAADSQRASTAVK